MLTDTQQVVIVFLMAIPIIAGLIYLIKRKLKADSKLISSNDIIEIPIERLEEGIDYEGRIN